MVGNYSLVARMGDIEKAREQDFAQQVREAKIAFMRQFYGTGDKYAKDIQMDAYHPKLHDTVAIDQRIKKETEALGYSLTNYAEHDRFYQDVAKEASLQGSQLDRLLYNHRYEFLAVISQAEGSSLKADPQKIATGDEAQRTDQRYPDTGDNVDAAFGEGADSAPLAPASAQEGVEAEGESDEAGKGEEETGGEGRAHADASNGA